ncbi:hypothetical protein PQX77_021430 [Marasmius sp. AFHP31]|nr:hypothetical protein PQX77_021430 [Marasmius sp. AFHP31]
MAALFSHAQGTTIGDHASFQNVAGNAITTYNYNNLQRDRITVNGKTVRVVMDSDVHYLHLRSSEILDVDVKPDDETSTSSKSQVVRMKKVIQTAEIFGQNGRFTATTLEPLNKGDQVIFKKIAERILQVAVCQRLALLTQVFAVTESNVLTMLSYNELASGDEVVSQYMNKNWIVFYYLHYLNNVAIQSLRDDEGLTFPVAHRWGDWSVNFKTLTWHYNPASLSLNPPLEISLQPLASHLPPLCQDTLPRLNATEVVAHVEENLGDFLYLLASGGGRWITDLSKYTRNGLLTFGAVIRRRSWHAEILAHFPSTPSPELFCQSRSSDVKVRYSNSGRVDLTFRKTGAVKVDIDFGLRIPYSNRLHAAYLCQSLHFHDGCRDVEDVIFINEVGFKLEGTFFEDPTTRATPAYLFISPLCTELVNGLHCIRFPFPQSLFYWSSDPHGRSKIAKKDWERLGIPELCARGLIGSYWDDEEYTVVREVLCQKNYNADGKRYAREHGHPELILGDPHDTTRIQDLDDSGPLHSEVQPSPPQLASTYLHVETSPDSHFESEYTPSLSNKITVSPTGWVKDFLKKYYLKWSDRKVKASGATGTQGNQVNGM